MSRPTTHTPGSARRRAPLGALRRAALALALTALAGSTVPAHAAPSAVPVSSALTPPSALPASSAAPVSAAVPVSSAAAGGVAPAALTPAPAEPTTPLDGSAPVLTVDDVSPTTVTADSTVRVRATVTNTGTGVVAEPRVSLSVVRYRLSSRSQLRAWYAGELTTIAPTPLTHSDLDAPLAPGASRTVELEVPAAELRLLPYPETSGPRGIVVDLADRTTSQGLASARSVLLWFPSPDVEPVRLSVVVPVTGPAASPADLESWGARLGQETAPGGRLDALLLATAAARDVTWLVDPKLVEVAQAGIGGETATAWAAALLGATTGREVFATDPFDPDVVAFAHARTQPFLTSSGSTLPSWATGWRTDLALPLAGTADGSTATAAAGARRSVVVDSGLGPREPGWRTSSGVASVPTSAGQALALVPDAELTALLTNAAAPQESRRLLLAELAVISQETPGQAPHVLVVTDRAWTPDAAATAATLTEVDAAPFVDLQPVASLMGAPADDVVRETLPNTSVAGSGLTVAQLNRLSTQVSLVTALSEVAADPQALRAGYLDQVAAVTSVAWDADPEGRAAQVRTALDAGDAILSGISVVEGSTLNLINESGALPVAIRNDLPQAVDVSVALRPDDTRLSVDAPVAVSIAPGSSTLVQIPVRAIGSGDVTVRVQILAAEGNVVAAPSQFSVRIRAEWESVGTAVVGGLLVLLLVGGIVRTVRRGRSSRRMDPIRPSDASPQETADVDA